MKMMGMSLDHMGRKPEKAEAPTAVEQKNPPKETFPSIYLSGDDVPGSLKGAKHDDLVVLVAKCRVANIGTDDGEHGKRYNVSLELQDVGIKPFAKKKASEMSEEEATAALENGDPVDEE